MDAGSDPPVSSRCTISFFCLVTVQQPQIFQCHGETGCSWSGSPTMKGQQQSWVSQAESGALLMCTDVVSVSVVTAPVPSSTYDNVFGSDYSRYSYLKVRPECRMCKIPMPLVLTGAATYSSFAVKDSTRSQTCFGHHMRCSGWSDLDSSTKVSMLQDDAWKSKDAIMMQGIWKHSEGVSVFRWLWQCGSLVLWACLLAALCRRLAA